MIFPRVSRRSLRGTRWTPFFLLSGLLGLTALSAQAQTPPSAPLPSAAASVKPPRLDYKITMLKNGLKVVTLEDHHAPVATVQVWYRVGSKDEPKGIYGFAHLFEHLMFKGSAHVPSEGHARFVEQVGGQYNADTFIDRTRYYETVSSNALDRMLFLEADRMATLKVDLANLNSERKVVEEEYRLRVANAPYGKLLENLQAMVYPAGHPYAHTTIGSIPDLDRATLAQVRAFHDTYYKPNNATLVVVGDFDSKTILPRIEKYFGAIPAATKPFPRLPIPADKQTGERRTMEYDKLAPLPMVGLTFTEPKPGDPDLPVFSVIDQILSQGDSSRLHRALVRQSQLAVQAQGINLDLKLGGVYACLAVANLGKDPKLLEGALKVQIERLRNEPVSADELTKAKNGTLAGLVFGEVSSEQKAQSLAEADLLYGTPEEVNKTYNQIAAVTAGDVQRVARKYFAPSKTGVFVILPGAMQPKETGKGNAK